MARVRATLPELPRARAARYAAGARPLRRRTPACWWATPALADFFDAALAARGGGPEAAKKVANWIIGELSRLMNETGLRRRRLAAHPGRGWPRCWRCSRPAPSTAPAAKVVVEELFRHGGDPAALVQEPRPGAGLRPGAPSRRWSTRCWRPAPAEVERHRSGKKDLTGFFVGQVMKALKGKGNPAAGQRAAQEEAGRPAADGGLTRWPGQGGAPAPAGAGSRRRAEPGLPLGLAALGAGVVTVVLALERSPLALLTGAAPPSTSRLRASGRIGPKDPT